MMRSILSQAAGVGLTHWTHIQGRWIRGSSVKRRSSRGGGKTGGCFSVSGQGGGSDFLHQHFLFLSHALSPSLSLSCPLRRAGTAGLSGRRFSGRRLSEEDSPSPSLSQFFLLLGRFLAVPEPLGIVSQDVYPNMDIRNMVRVAGIVKSNMLDIICQP